MGRDKFKEEYDIGKTMARKIVLAPMIQSTKDIISNGEWYVYFIKSMRWAPFYSYKNPTPNKMIIKEVLFWVVAVPDNLMLTSESPREFFAKHR